MDRTQNMGIIDVKREISVIYNIFIEIYARAPPILKDLSADIDYKEWKEWIGEPMDFQTISDNFHQNRYPSITDAVKDMRVVFLNCYKYYGINSDLTKKSLQLEELLENRLSALDDDLHKAFADIKLTILWLRLNENTKSNVSYPKGCYESRLLKSVAHYHAEPFKKGNDELSCSTTNKDTTYTATTNKDTTNKDTTNKVTTNNAHVSVKIPDAKEEITSNKPRRSARVRDDYAPAALKYKKYIYECAFEIECRESDEDSNPEDEWGAIHKIKINKKQPK